MVVVAAAAAKFLVLVLASRGRGSWDAILITPTEIALGLVSQRLNRRKQRTVALLDRVEVGAQSLVDKAGRAAEQQEET